MKIGDKIMGFHYHVGGNSFFAGEISEIDEDTNSIRIIPTSCGYPMIINTLVDQITNFDQEIYDKANVHQSKANNLQVRREFEELCIRRLLMKQPITKTFEEYYDR